MKIIKVFLLMAVIISGLSFLTDNAQAGRTYYMSVGEAVDLKWDSQNVLDCRAANNYYTSAWGTSGIPGFPAWSSWAAAPSRFGSMSFAAGVVSQPGVFSFQFNCSDDEAPFARIVDDTTAYVFPAMPTSPTSVCNGGNTSRNLSWGAVTGATSYVVLVGKPAAGSCPTGWTTMAATLCQRTVATNSTSFDTVSGAAYTWSVASRAGTLVSANTNGAGAHISDAYASGTGFSCTVAASVNLNFTP